MWLVSTIEERTWSREHFDDPAIEYMVQRWLTWAPPGRGRRQVGKRRQATWQAAADESVGAAAELQRRRRRQQHRGGRPASAGGQEPAPQRGGKFT